MLSFTLPSFAKIILSYDAYPSWAINVKMSISSSSFANTLYPYVGSDDGTQDNVQTTQTGDVTKDGVINVKDVVAVINRCLDSESEEVGLYDVTGDGKVDVKDVVQVINLSLQ